MHEYIVDLVCAVFSHRFNCLLTLDLESVGPVTGASGGLTKVILHMSGLYYFAIVKYTLRVFEM